MRQALFAILLVLASFAGGAVVNGPGLEWARAQIQALATRPRSATLEDEFEEDPDLAKVENSGGAPGSAVAPGSVAPTEAPAVVSMPEARVGERSPMAPPPALPFIGDVASPGSVANDQSPATPPEVAAPRGPTLVSAETEHPPVRAASEAGAPAPPPSQVGDREAMSRTPDVAVVRPLANGEPWSDVADSSAPAEAVVPNSPGATALEGGSPVDAGLARAAAGSRVKSGPAGAWDELQVQMQRLGVVRYWVEAVVDGPARFRCVVPLVGEQVVSQHFEAEGITAVDAARAALRRVALWRAARAN